MNNWIGTFESCMYSALFVSGTVSITLPQLLSDAINTEITIKYEGLYDHGKELKISCSGRKKDDAYIFTCKFGSQQFIFTSTTITNSEIKGIYVTESPSDQGVFTMNRNYDTQLMIK